MPERPALISCAYAPEPMPLVLAVLMLEPAVPWY